MMARLESANCSRRCHKRPDGLRPAHRQRRCPDIIKVSHIYGAMPSRHALSSYAVPPRLALPSLLRRRSRLTIQILDETYERALGKCNVYYTFHTLVGNPGRKALSSTRSFARRTSPLGDLYDVRSPPALRRPGPRCTHRLSQQRHYNNDPRREWRCAEMDDFPTGMSQTLGTQISRHITSSTD